MKIELLGNGTWKEIVAELETKIENLEEATNNQKDSDYLESIKEFLSELKETLERDIDYEERVRIVSTAGQLSREKGNVLDVYERRKDSKKNTNLAKNVINYGHKTISDHDYLVFGLKDVSRFVEQTIISYRLTSFTIKSGRNVDFRNAGYYAPDFRDKDGNILPNNEKLKEIYSKHMDNIFHKYGEYIDMGVPVEEARYTLPFGYKTNIVMGCDAEEFFRITCDLLYGKSSKITELHEVGLEFEKILRNNCPYLIDALDKEKGDKKYEDNLAFLDTEIKREKEKLLDNVRLLKCTKNTDETIATHAIARRYNISYEEAKIKLNKLLENSKYTKEDIIRGVYKNRRQRELEQVSFTFETPIELSILPQFTRHRMQSLEVPDFAPLWNTDNYLYPDHDEDQNAHIDREEYIKLFEDNALLLEKFKKEGIRDEDLIYFYLGGNACNIKTTIDFREIIWMCRMRSCNKSQKGIRNISNQIIEEISNISPTLGSLLGPSCKVNGYCTEGKDSCKSRGVVVLKKEIK